MSKNAFITGVKNYLLGLKRISVIQALLLAALLMSGAFLFSLQPGTEPLRSVIFHQDWAAEKLPFLMPTLDLFDVPGRICSIESYGAVGDSTTINTGPINAAIHDCSEKGGGTVLVPAGIFLTGPIRLESHVTLDVSAGAELRFSQNFEDYLPTVFTRYEGMELYNYSPFIYADNCQDIAITGTGRLNGQGEAWWMWKGRQQTGAKRLYAMADQNLPVQKRQFGTPEAGLRPSFIQFVRCTRIRIEGVHIENGPMWTIHPLYSKDILIRNIQISTIGPNTDGIVLDSSQNALVDHVLLSTEDDAIVLKSGVDADGRRVGIPTENIVIKNCQVGQGNSGVAIGSETTGNIRNVFVSGCRFEGTKRGLRMKSAPGRGGTVENISMENIVMTDIQAEAIALDMFYDSKNVVNSTSSDLPLFRNISFRNISAIGALDAIKVTGAMESPINDLSFQDIVIKAINGAVLQNVDTLHLDGVHIESTRWPTITATNIEHGRFSGRADTPSRGPLLGITGAKTTDIQIDTTYPRSKVRTERGVPKSAVLWKEQ